jgi:hypothetical protein
MYFATIKGVRMYKSIISLLVMLPIAAFAEGAASGGSEFFYQSAAGKQDVTPSLQMNSQSEEVGGGAEDTTDTTVLRAEYERGIQEGLSAGVALGYVVSGENDDGTTTTDITGLQNIDVFVKASMAAGPGALKYGANLSLSPGDQELDGDELNAYTGGHSLTPYVGYEMASGACTYGAKLAVDFGLTDRTLVVGATDTEYSGGEDTTISLFYEHEFNADMTLGASLDWVTTSDTTNETSGGDTENISPTQVISLYLPTKVGSGLLLPELEYGMTTADQVNNADVDSYNQLNIKVGYRIEL